MERILFQNPTKGVPSSSGPAVLYLIKFSQGKPILSQGEGKDLQARLMSAMGKLGTKAISQIQGYEGINIDRRIQLFWQSQSNHSYLWLLFTKRAGRSNTKAHPFLQNYRT